MPDDLEPRGEYRRAPNGEDRVHTTMRLRRDLKNWLAARAKKRSRSATLELEAILDELRRKERK